MLLVGPEPFWLKKERGFYVLGFFFIHSKALPSFRGRLYDVVSVSSCFLSFRLAVAPGPRDGPHAVDHDYPGKPGVRQGAAEGEGGGADFERGGLGAE